MAEYTINPKATFGEASTETLAADLNNGLPYYKSEKKVWKGIAVLSFIVAAIGLVLACFGYVQSNVASKIAGGAASCRLLKGPTGIYYIQPDPKLGRIAAYCDMESAGGGWTLVAAIHENNIDGKCTVGDNWSSDQGFSIRSNYNGTGSWENINIFGSLLSLTNDDYKNIAYYATKGKDVMVWHVPNNLPINQISSSAFLKYYTTNGFLTKYGGTLQSLYSTYTPLVHAGSSRFFTHVAPPITFLKGTNDTIMEGIPNNLKDYVQPGFLQFRAFDDIGYPNALCPGIRLFQGNSARVCIGGGGAPSLARQGTASRTARDSCGDFAGWNGASGSTATQDNPSDTGKALRDINSSIFLFVR